MTQPDHPPPASTAAPLHYQRCRFSADLPQDRLYTPDHLWLQQQAPGVWRVGLTPWAVRMLGDFVEYHFEAAPGATVKLSQPLGTLEAFKGLIEIRALATGSFIQGNPVLAANLDAITQDCFGTGWLYLIQGDPDPDTHDAAAYQCLLDQTIDTLRGGGPPEPA